MGRRATIADVAELAGVSRAAVSKVLRDAYGVSDDMRRRVGAAIAALAYRPQTAARGLRGSTETLGVILPDIRNPFFPDVLDGVLERLQNTRYNALLGVRPSVRNDETLVVEAMLDRKLDGMIMIAPLLKAAALRKVADQVPLVVIGLHTRSSDFDTVNCDDFNGARAAVSHLVERGHRKILYCGLKRSDCGPANPVVERQKGYFRAMSDLGLERFAECLNVPYAHSREAAQARLSERLKRSDRPTAIFAWTDMVALLVLEVAKGLRLEAPKDLAVVGYDNSALCSAGGLSITSVDQSARRLGRLASELFLERLGGRARARHEVLPSELIARGSTSPPPRSREGPTPSPPLPFVGEGQG